MLKYTLRIEGSAEEIERNKKYHIIASITKVWIDTSINEAITPAIEYIIREPKYRYKTFLELAESFGDRMLCEVNTITIDQLHCPRSALGTEILSTSSHIGWNAIFLKEIT